MVLDKQKIIVFCPDCEEELHFDAMSEMMPKVICPNCWANLTVTSLAPLKLGWAADMFEKDQVLRAYWSEDSW